MWVSEWDLLYELFVVEIVIRLIVAGVWLDSAICQILTCVDIKPFSE